MIQLPGIAGDIEAVIGFELTVKLLRKYGGTEIAISGSRRDSSLAKIIGQSATDKMIKEYGVGKVNLPTAGLRGLNAIQRQRKEQAIASLKDGMSVRQVALTINLHERTVWRYKSEIDDRQIEMGFDRL